MTTTELPSAVEVISRLNALGSYDAIANHLRERGIRGVYDNGIQCPVARYVAAETGRIVCMTASIWIDDDEEGTYRYTPDRVSDFIDKFDARAYPHLVEETFDA